MPDDYSSTTQTTGTVAVGGSATGEDCESACETSGTTSNCLDSVRENQGEDPL